MGKLVLIQQYSSNITSDEVTASRNDLVKGKTTVTKDSGNEIAAGTLELTGTVTDGDVVAGKSYYSTDPHIKKTGTLKDNSSSALSATATLDASNSRLQLTIPSTAKYSTSSKLYSTYTVIRNLIGLTAAKIANGQSVLGLTGTYKGLGNATAADVRKGKTFSSAALNNVAGTMAEKPAATYTPGTANQTIAANQYLTGVQTIKGDAKLTAANIRSGVSIFGKTGSCKYADFTGTTLYESSTSFTATSWSYSGGDDPQNYKVNGGTLIATNNIGGYMLLQLGIRIGSDYTACPVWYPLGTFSGRMIPLKTTTGYNGFVNVIITRNQSGQIYIRPLRGSSSGTYYLRIKYVLNCNQTMAIWD